MTLPSLDMGLCWKYMSQANWRPSRVEKIRNSSIELVTKHEVFQCNGFPAKIMEVGVCFILGDYEVIKR